MGLVGVPGQVRHPVEAVHVGAEGLLHGVHHHIDLGHHLLAGLHWPVLHVQRRDYLTINMNTVKNG